MDFKNPNNGILRKIFSSYTDNILPVLGEKVVGDSETIDICLIRLKHTCRLIR